MKTHDLTVCNRPYPFLDRIMDGSKTVEGRTYSPLFQKMCVGDHLKLFNHEKWVLCQIKALHVYGSFRQMLEAETLQKVLPGHANIDTAVQMYHQFPRFEENERRYGVVAIEIEKISSGNFNHSRQIRQPVNSRSDRRYDSGSSRMSGNRSDFYSDRTRDSDPSRRYQPY